ncbi:MAG: hypothetical protein IPG81_33480 [Sandaracinaceae bacterium]|nr:hypothetical protein [Sandaracinaceae bacterium]
MSSDDDDDAELGPDEDVDALAAAMVRRAARIAWGPRGAGEVTSPGAEPRVARLVHALRVGLGAAEDSVRTELGLAAETDDRDVAHTLVQILSACHAGVLQRFRWRQSGSQSTKWSGHRPQPERSRTRRSWGR